MAGLGFNFGHGILSINNDCGDASYASYYHSIPLPQRVRHIQPIEQSSSSGL